MEILLSILVLIWLLGYIFVIVYIYKKNSKPYLSEFLEISYDHIPSSLNPNELSVLLYKKVVPASFVAITLFLIKKEIITIEKKENEYFLIYHETTNLSISQKYVISILFDTIAASNHVSLTAIEKYTKVHSNATNVLMEYNLFKRAAYKDVRYQFYEDKKGYSFVKKYSYAGIALMLANLLLSFHSIPIYFLIVPIFFLYLYFYGTYKRTYKSNTEYFKWLGFKHYLLYAKKIEENREIVYIYSTVLGCLEEVAETYKDQESFAVALEKSLTKSLHRAILHGDRRLHFPWNLK